MTGKYSNDIHPRGLQPLAEFCRDRHGATAIEYALIGAGLSIAIAVVVPEIGTAVSAIFTDVKNGF